MRNNRARADLGEEPGTDRIAIRAGASQSCNQIASAARRFVPEHDAGLVMMNDDEVEVAVRVKIAAGQAATHMEFL